jgi:hypothetical protein
VHATGGHSGTIARAIAANAKLLVFLKHSAKQLFELKNEETIKNLKT